MVSRSRPGVVTSLAFGGGCVPLMQPLRSGTDCNFESSDCLLVWVLPEHWACPTRIFSFTYPALPCCAVGWVVKFAGAGLARSAENAGDTVFLSRPAPCTHGNDFYRPVHNQSASTMNEPPSVHRWFLNIIKRGRAAHQGRKRKPERRKSPAESVCPRS